MTAVIRKTLWAALALAALSTACSPPPPVKDGGTGGGGGGTTECIEDTDCPDPVYFACNTITSTCEPSCRSAAQCNPAGGALGGQRPQEYSLDFCGGSLGCQCDDFKCVGSLCSSDSDCGTQVCRSGACVPPPAASTVARCAISPDLVVLRQGAKAKFWVSAWDASNAPVVLKDGITWSSVNAAAAGSGTGFSAEFTAGSAPVATATAAVQAAIGSVNCQAKVIVLPNPAAGEVAVSVIDELSGRPVAGAKVVVSQENGTIIQQAGNADFKDTDATGFAALSLTGSPAKFSVSVFHPDFSYVTVANYAATGSRFLSFALRRNSLDKYGGYKGGYSNVPETPNLHAALAGLSLAGSITNLNLTALLGPTVPTDIVVGTQSVDDAPIPAGAYLGFGASTFKGEIAGQGLNGTCGDEAKVLAGECGTRTAWSLSGDVPIAQLPLNAVSGGVDKIDVSALLGQIIPIFKTFNSSVIRDVEYTLKPTPMDGGEPDYSNQSHYTNARHAFMPSTDGGFGSIPLGFSFALKMPELPRFKGTYVDGAAVIGGASVPGRGVVPLGIGVGINTTPVDGQIDRVEPLQVGQLGVRMAPTHHGIEGSTYGLVVAAISAKAMSDASAGIGASAIFPRLPQNKLVFDPKGASPIDVSASAFPAFPEGARFNFTSAADGAVPGRSFRLAAMTGVGVLRVSFSDSLQTRWDVLVDAAAPGFTLPVIPAGTTLRDRLFDNGNGATGGRSELTVQAFRMAKDPAAATQAALSFTEYVEFNDWNSDRTTDFLAAFSFLSYGKPKVGFKEPKASGATVARGSKIIIEVSGFSVGTMQGTDDGVVRLTFTGGTGCDPATLNTEVPAKGSGELEYTIPTTCSGANVSIKAELMKVNGTDPILPAVSRTITANIQ